MKLIVLALLAESYLCAANYMKVKNIGGSTVTAVKIAVRGFKKGEIIHYPRPSVTGTALTTWQVDAVNRYNDGTVRTAIVSFPLANMTAGEERTVDFVDAGSCTGICGAADQRASSTGSALTSAQILAFNSASWDIEVQLTYNGTGGSTKNVSARTILQDDVTAGRQCGDPLSNCVYWLKGPVVTEVILQGPLDDQTNFFRYTVGFDQGFGLNNPVRPRFNVRIIPSWTTSVWEDASIFGDMSTRLEEQAFNYSVLNGSTFGNPVYNAPKNGACTTTTTCGVLLHPTQALRKYSWDPPGSAPPDLKTSDYNLKYLGDAGIVPNFDVDNIGVIPGSVATYWINKWNTSDKCANYDSFAFYTTVFTNTGGRWDLGPLNQLNALAMFNPLFTASGSTLLWRDFALGLSQCSATMPIHLTESRADATLFCNFSCTGSNATAKAFGKPLSIEARPTFYGGVYGNAWKMNLGGVDKLTPINMQNTASAGTQWTIDGAHTPDMWYGGYLQSDGEYYYYHELKTFAAYLGLQNDPGPTYHHGNWGMINYMNIQTRGYAWSHRTYGGWLTVGDQTDPMYQYTSKHYEYDARVGEGAIGLRTGNYPPSPSNTTCSTFNLNTSNAVSDMWCYGYLYLGHYYDTTNGFLANTDNNVIPFGGPRRAANKPAGLPIDFVTPLKGVVGIEAVFMMQYKEIVTAWNIRRDITYDSAVFAAEALGYQRLFQGPGAVPWLMAQEEIPTTKDDGTGTVGSISSPGSWIKNMTEWRNAWMDGWNPPGGTICVGLQGVFHYDSINSWFCSGYNSNPNASGSLEVYAQISRAATAMMAGVTGLALDGTTMLNGLDLYKWVMDIAQLPARPGDIPRQVASKPWSGDPRYALVPYGAAVPLNTFTVSPTSLSFTCTGGVSSGAVNVSLGTTGAAVPYTATPSQTWLLLTPTSGTTPATISADVDCGALTGGQYSSNITFSTTTSGVPPAQVGVVNLIVSDHIHDFTKTTATVMK